jgi:hypothetical protein
MSNLTHTESIVVNIHLNARVRPRVAQAMRRYDLEMPEFKNELSNEVRLTGELMDGGTNERFLVRIKQDLTLVLVEDEDGLVAIGTTHVE